MIPSFINLFSRYLRMQNILLNDRNIVITKSKDIQEIYINCVH